MTRGKFTIDDQTNSVTLYTFHDGHTQEAIESIYALMSLVVEQSAARARVFLSIPADQIDSHPAWKLAKNAPWWLTNLVMQNEGKKSLCKLLDTPGRLEKSYNFGIRYDTTDAVGVANMMTSLYWDRWFPFPETYIDGSEDDFLVKLRKVGDGSMDYVLHVEVSDEYEINWDPIKAIPGVVSNEDGPPSVNLGEQFWMSVRRELSLIADSLPTVSEQASLKDHWHIEQPYEIQPNDIWFFQTCITHSGAVGGEHIPKAEVERRLEAQTGPGELVLIDGIWYWKLKTSADASVPDESGVAPLLAPEVDEHNS